jgi:predicted Zn-dependent protease
MRTALVMKTLRGFVAATAGLALCVTPAAAQGGGISLVRDAEIENTLTVYTEPVLRAAGLDPADVKISIVGDATVNAFVTGGQRIFVHTGLIMEAQNPNEIIGVLAHETGHISGGHLARSREAMRYAMRPALIAIGLGILAIAAGAPDAGAALIAGSGQFAQGNFVRHTQIQESSADQAGAALLEQTGQSGAGLISFFNREFRPHEYAVRRVPAYMVTHPFTSDRIEALRRRVEAAEHYDVKDTPENVRRFQFMQAKLVGFTQPLARTLQVYPPSDRSQAARYARAIAYCGCGVQAKVPDLVRARAEINSLIADDPRNPYFQELAGQILYENGRAAESLPYHRRALELAPRTALLEINLARAMLQADERAGADEAIRLLQRALQSEPENAFAWRTLAEAHEAKGQEGLARLASAEQAYSVGDFGTAVNFAERARRTLTQGTVSWQRASDIVVSVRNSMPEDEEPPRRRQGG